MKYIVSELSGFCHGVYHTISSIEELLFQGRQDVYCIGLPVHNPQVTNKLIDLGLKVVENIDDIPSGTLVVRAHGLPPTVLRRAEEKGLIIVNTTCGFVQKAQRIAKELYAQKYTVVIVGESNHPEVKSIYGETDNTALIVSSAQEINAGFTGRTVGVLTQTTFSVVKFKEIICRLFDLTNGELRIFNTSCNSIEKRSVAAKKIAESVDVMIIIGGKMSSNTKRLFEACQIVNQRSFHVETSDELQHIDFTGVATVGVTAGASTPKWLIDEMCARISKM